MRITDHAIIANIRSQLLVRICFVLEKLSEENTNIAGFVKSVIFLNNKVIVRIKFETRNCIKEAKYQFVKLPFVGYVLLPADDLLSKDLAVHAEKCKAAIQ